VTPGSYISEDQKRPGQKEGKQRGPAQGLISKVGLGRGSIQMWWETCPVVGAVEVLAVPASRVEG